MLWSVTHLRVFRTAAQAWLQSVWTVAGYLLGNKTDPGVSLWELKEKFSDKREKMFLMKFRKWGQSIIYGLHLAPLASAKIAISQGGGKSPELRKFLISSLSCSCPSMTPCQWTAYIGRQDSPSSPQDAFFLLNTGWLTCKRVELSCFSSSSVFLCIKWAGESLIVLPLQRLLGTRWA